MASNATVNRQVNIYISSGEAQKALDKLIAKEKLLKDELAKATDPKKIAALNKELAKLSEPIDRATKKIKGELTPSFRELQQAAAAAIGEFKKTGDPEALARYQKFNALLQEQKNLINNVNNAQQGLTRKGIFTSAFWANLAAGGIAAATAAISNFFRSSVDEAKDAELATARLKGTLDNLGRTDVFDRMIRKADQMAERFKFLDNDDVLGVFKKLIDYGKLTEKEMNDLLPVIIDFASNQRISLEESTEVITKALEGNGKALKTYGIDVKDAKTETERLNIIMTTLKDKVDGAADAFGNTLAGQLAITRQQFNNMSEDLGNELLPILTKIGDVALTVVRNLKTFGKAVVEAATGGSGFFAINKDAITQDPNFKATIDQLTEQRVATFDAVEKNVEKSLGRKLTKSSADQKLLKDVQDKVLAGFLAAANNAQKRIDELKKDFKNNANEAAELRTLLETSEASIRGIDTIKSRSTKTIGVTQIKTPTVPDTKEADKKRKQEIDAYNAFLKKIDELNEEFDINQEDGFQKDLLLLQKKIDGLKEEAAKFKENKDLLLGIDELYRKESLELIDKYTKLDQQKFDAAAQEQAKKIAAFYQKQFEALTVLANTTTRDKAAKDELAILNAKGDEKIALQKAQIQREADAEVEEEIKKLTKLGATRENAENQLQNVIALIRQKARDKEEELETKNIVGKIETILPFAQQALGVLDTFFAATNAKEDAQLARDRKVNDAKKANFKRQLDGKIITQREYDQQLKKLEKEQAKAEYEAELKQFKRQQITSIAQAVINGALGATKTISTLGFPLAIPFLILEAAAVVASIVAINKQKPAPPTFAKGGKLGGRSHAAGGNPILDGDGKKIAEIEAGEGIVNKKSMQDNKTYSVKGTPSQIASSINTLHGGVNWESGATISPAWKTISPQRMNFPAMKKAYATGGVFQSTANSQQSAADESEMRQTLVVLTDTVMQLREQMRTPIKAYTLISEQEKQQLRLDAIRNDSTMK